MKILNFGSCNIDYVYRLDHIVNGGETEHGDRLDIFPGGKGLNQSVALARAGAEVFHAAVFGNDGGFLSDILKSNGADVSLSKTVNEKNGHAIIQVNNDGENAIIVYPGTNHLINNEYADYVLSHFGKGDFLILQNEINELEYIINTAFSRGMKIILNPSPIRENLKKIDLNKLYCLVMNEHEAQKMLGGETAEQCLEKAEKELPETAVVITLGKRGAVYSDREKRVYQAAYEVKAVDTTAVGDTFTGYFAAGLCRQDPIEKILKQAAAAAAISVSRNGAAPSIPLLAEVCGLLPSMTERKTDKKAAEQLKITENYIEKNLKQALLKGLAEELNYSYNSAGDLVRRLIGMPFTEYLQTKRLNEAMRLLEETSLSVLEISNAVGYENDSFFRRKFKERFSVTPKQYRMNKGVIKK